MEREDKDGYYIVEKTTIKKAYKPFDIVSDNDGNIGFIQEVSVNKCQPNPIDQISYAVKWLAGDNIKHAWFDHKELKKHCNLFVKIAECACHPMGDNKEYVNRLLGGIDK